MKKAILFLCLIISVIVLSGCGEQKAKNETAGERTPMVEKVRSVIPDTEELAELTEDDLADILGIQPEDYTEFVFLQSSGTDGREILAIRTKDRNAADRVAAQAKDYLERRRNETRNYIPELYQLLNNTNVMTGNMTVVLVVGQDAETEANKILKDE